MSRYKVVSYRRGVKSETEPTQHLGVALNQAFELKPTATVITVVQDQEGTDHPANAGKFFLYRIIK